MEASTLPEVVLVRIFVNDRGDKFTYRWFTKGNVANFERPDGTGSPDSPVSDVSEFAEYCGIEIAEPYFGMRWTIIENIIGASVSSFRLHAYDLPYGIDARYHLAIPNALKELFDIVLANPAEVGKVRECLMAILTQLQNPNLAIENSLGSSESQTIKQVQMNIRRELDNAQTDHTELLNMFTVVEHALDEYFQTP